MKTLNKIRFIPLLLTLLLVFMMLVPGVSTAQPSVNLGSAANFAVLAGSTITNTGSSVITGDLGLSPGSAVTGFPPGTLNGTAYVSDGAGVASKAKTDLQTAYNEATAATSTAVYGLAVNIGGETFGPGVYDFPSSVEITGPVTLNGSASDVFIFRIGTTLTTASGSSVILDGSVNPDNVFWQVGTSATLGTSSIFKGNILAEISITGTTSAVIGGRLLAITGAVTLDTNTITNPTPTPTPTPDLNVIKVVSGSAASPSVFLIHVKTAGTSGSDVVGSPQYGSNSGTAYTLASGTYVVSEDASAAPAGYTASYSSGGSVIGTSASSGNITLVSGVLKTVTITNTYTSTTGPGSTTATLHVIKTVVGGTEDTADFEMHVTSSGIDVAGSPALGVGSPGTPYTLAPGVYVVSETAAAGFTDSGYTATYSGSDASGSGTTTLASGDNKTVTITNTYTSTTVPGSTPAILHVIKHVSGGTAVAGAFNLHVKTAGSDVAGSPAPGVESPGTPYTLAAGTYVVSEDSYAGYTESYSGASDSSGNITLASGDNKTVTITNTYIPTTVPGSTPATLLVIKDVIGGGPEVAADFSLHVTSSGTDVSGSPQVGTESGTPYTLAPGTYVVSETAAAGYTLAGYTESYSGASDSSGNITLASGDNKTVTITNTYIPIPSGGGGTSGTSGPSIPPLIKVIKTPDPLALTSGGGSVTYTYTVTNPGTVALSNVTVTDNKVSPVTYVSGDVNGDKLLQPSETWIYTGTTNLTATTTDTATAIGSANGLTATGIASATVVVASPVVVTSPGTSSPGTSSPGTSPVVVTPTALGGVATPTAPGGVVTRTVTGGQLPKTSTPFSAPMYELLLIGAVLTLVGAVGWRNRKRYE
jgi:hypothetical protein